MLHGGQLLKDGVPEDEFPPKLVGFTPAQFGMERVARKGLERLRWEQERYQPFALSVYNGRTPELRSVNAPLRMPANSMSVGELEETCVLSGGDPFSKEAPCGLLEFSPPLQVFRHRLSPQKSKDADCRSQNGLPIRTTR